MRLHYKEWMVLVLCIVSIVTGILFYPMMPERIVSHWGANGEPNGFMSAFWGSFILPIVIVLMFLLLIFVPRADPMRENIKKFNESFLNFLIILFLFMYILQLYMVLWNLGYLIDIVYVIVPLFAILFFYTGIMLSKAQQNMTIGIRTPWTLKSKISWDKTHKRAGVLLKIVSVLFLLGIVFRGQAFIIMMVPLLAVFIYLFFYSYKVYADENKSSKKHPKKH